MGLLEGFNCRCQCATRHWLTPRWKILFATLICFLAGLQVTETTFADGMNKLLGGPSQHGKRLPRWNPDAKTKLRVRRALEDSTSPGYDGGGGVTPSQDFIRYKNDDCPEHLKYELSDIFEQSYKGPVCDIIDARNDAENMKDLENCVIVNGFVHLVFMHDLTEADLKKYRFPKLRVITHYLLVFRMFNLKTLGYMFPNLAVIGGRELFNDYALVLYENPHMKEVGLANLQFIRRGGVRIQKNPMMCYLNTIDWQRLGRYSENRILANKMVLTDNRDADQCVDQCGDDSSCEVEAGQELCWSVNMCQKKLCPDKCPHACYRGECRCHDECLAGCWKPNDQSACVACRNYYHNGTCLSECPAGSYLIHDWLCIKKEECQRLDWNFFGNRCQRSCPHGYQVNVTECMNKCTKCSSNCGQVCEGDPVVSDVHSLRRLEGCREIVGTLTISINGGSEVVERLDDALKDIEVIGSLIVRRSFPLVTLNFLRNIKRITGQNKEQGIYSVYILENKNLKELWNFEATNMKIEQGKAFFHFNPQLCRSKVREIEQLTPETEDHQDISDTTNGDKATCHFALIKVLEEQISDEPFVKIVWEKFIVKDERTLIGYQVFYKESPEKNAKKNEGVDACRLNSWTIVDKPKSKDTLPIDNDMLSVLSPNFTQPGETSKLLSGLKAYTQYAYYIQAYTTSTAESGAASEIRYFRTKPAQPMQPRNLRATAITTSSIDITWDAPLLPNGNITHYVIEWKRQEEEDLPSIRSINTCKPGYNKVPVRKPFIPKSSVEQSPKGDENKSSDDTDKDKQCNCQCDKDQLSKEDELEAQESSDFENYLQDEIFLAVSGPDFGIIEPVADYGMPYDLMLFGNGSDTNLRRKRSVRIANGTGNASTTEITPTVLSASTMSVENQTTPKPEDPTFMKRRMIVIDSNEATLTGLHYYSEYNIQVYACNHASNPLSKTDLNYKIKEEIGRDRRFTRCSIEALTMKRTAPNKTADTIPEDSVKILTKAQGMTEGVTRLRWKMPVDPNAYIRLFTIEVSSAENENAPPLDEICVHINANVTDTMSYDITSANAIPPGIYHARVRPTSLSGDGSWSKPVQFEVSDTDKQDTVVLIVVLSVFALFLALLLGGIVFYVRRKKNMANRSCTYEDYNPDYSRYVYSPDEYEISIEKVTILEEIGHGNFGKVYSGIGKSVVKDEEETKVAIKKLHENAMASRRYEFLKEASIMKAFNAHHVVRLLGVVSQTVDPMVIMEYMEKGDLKSFLRSRRDNVEENAQHLPPPTSQEKLQMSAEIADGMAYLAGNKFVHRDLAARNCLVNEHGTVKIGDFGLTRDIYENDYYRKESRGFLPIRWMAPESLRDGVFDSRSDVWSYGVVLWELATLAEQPYQGQQHDEVTRFVIDGGYMERPRNCPRRLYDLMTLCWQYNPKMRPMFIEIVQELYVDVNDEFKEVCFYGKHHRVGTAEDEETQFVLPHENGLDSVDAIYPRNDMHVGPSPAKQIAGNNWNGGDHSFRSQKNFIKSDRSPSRMPPAESDENRRLIASTINRSPSMEPATAPGTTTPSSVGHKWRRSSRNSSESSYENDFEDEKRTPRSHYINARDSGTYISANRTPKLGDKHPLIGYKHMNGGPKRTKDLEVDLESGVEMCGMCGNSSTASLSNPSTPTEMHAMLPSAGQNDDSLAALLRPTATSGVL